LVTKPYNQLVDHLTNQADMCLIVRSMMMNGRMPNICKDYPECKSKFSCDKEDADECKTKFINPVPENKVQEVSEIIKNMF